MDAAGARVRRQSHAPPVALPPELEQRRRQQRQRARLAFNIRQQRVDELGLDLQADPLRGSLDRALQLVARHRPDEHVVGTEQARELGVGGTTPVEVGAHGDHNHACALRIASGAHQLRDELAPFPFLLAGGENLFELVDGQHDAPTATELTARGAKLAHRVLTRTDQ